MHDTTAEHWHEITRNTKKAGLGTFKRAPMVYDRFMVEQEIPIFRGIGISKVQNLRLAPWKRMSGRGSFIQLYGPDDYGAIDLRVGGMAIPYDEEDPHVRGEYEDTLRKQGATSRIEQSLYESKHA
jgi:hypothetical protein